MRISLKDALIRLALIAVMYVVITIQISWVYGNDFLVLFAAVAVAIVAGRARELIACNTVDAADKIAKDAFFSAILTILYFFIVGAIGLHNR